MLLDKCDIMEVGSVHGCSVSGAREAMLRLSAGKTHAGTYMSGAGKRSGVLTSYGGS